MSSRRGGDIRTWSRRRSAARSRPAAPPIAAADDAYREAERDLLEAQRREARARDRLKEARDDLDQARKDGRDAADDAETAAIGLRFALAGVPSGVLALPGMPAQGRINDAAGIPRPDSGACRSARWSRRTTGRAGRSRGSRSAAAR